MPLFRDLDPQEQRATKAETVRQETLVGSILLDVVRRSTAFLIIVLLSSGVALLLSGAHYAYWPPLFLASLILFVLALLCVGVLFAINHQLLIGLVTKVAWFRYRLLDSQIDTALLNSPPPSLPRAQRVAVASAYAAFALWVIGAGLGIAAFAVHVPASTAYATAVPQSPAPAASQSASAHAQASSGSQASWILADEIAFGALAAGLVQAVAVIWTVLLARKTAQRQLRAYVVPETYDLLSGSVMNPPQPEYANDPAVFLMLRNTGQTPAYKVRTHAQLAVIAPAAESTLVVPPLAPEQYSLLGPGVTSRINRRLSRNLTPPEIAAIQSGAAAIYLYGRTEYVDAFRKKRFTTFRMRYSGQWPLTAAAGMTFALEGNHGN